jgi:hypothetical protein
MDLLNDRRLVIHSGRLLTDRQPNNGLEWSELHVVLFDNYRE